MTIDPGQLLRKLSPPVRPVGGGSAPAGRIPLDQQSFGELLALVADGGLTSNRPIDVAPGAELTEPLTDQQLGRIGAAADQAQAAGAGRAIMLIDGRGLVLDVTGRTIASELGPDAPPRVEKLDAAVYVPDADEQELVERRPLTGPGAGVIPARIAEQIAAAQAHAAHQIESQHVDDPPARAAG